MRLLQLAALRRGATQEVGEPTGNQGDTPISTVRLALVLSSNGAFHIE